MKELREFFWDCLCDWYIELTKPRLTGDPSSEAAKTAKQVLAFCVDQAMRLWHPTMPFITERLWAELNAVAPKRGLPGVADLTTDDLRRIDPEHANDLDVEPDPRAAAERRVVRGGTAWSEILRQVGLLRQTIEPR